MPDIQQFAFGAIERIASHRSSDDVLSELRNCGSIFEYENFCISGLPAPHEKADPYVLLSGWPEQWITHYLKSDFIHVDPVIRKVRQSTMPFLWSEAHYSADDRPAARVMNEAKAFGLSEGFAVPIISVDGAQAIVTFGAPHFDIPERHRRALHVVAIFAHSQIRDIRKAGSGSKPSPRKVHLSSREVECLRWAAAGKTAWETSEILHLSEQTVAQYMKSAAKKLGAQNKGHAIAEAMRASLII
jgi:LuxR family transcriptional regulator, quorum-sensing system regulator BjaR1